MAQPQPQMPQRHFSPPQPQNSPSPASSQPSFPMPPNVRPKLSPQPPSRPQSPYPQSPYAASPGAPLTPSTGATSVPSPTLPGSQQPNGQPLTNQSYNTPSTNGNGTPTGPPTPSLALPESRPTPPPLPAAIAPQPQPQSPAPTLPGPPPSGQLPYTNVSFGVPPIAPAMHHQQQQYPQQQQQQQPMLAPYPTPGVMGPPSRPPDRPQKELEYDPTDLMAGTGIDLRAEEAYLAGMYAVDTSVPESRTGFTIHPPGDKASFYGAGVANQTAEPVGNKSQDQHIAAAAEKAWQDSARNLASERAVELRDPFLNVPILQLRAEAAAKEAGISLNWELKSGVQPMGRMKVMDEHPRPVKVETRTGPDGSLIRTCGSWIPHDASLADQMALLSIATKQRLRALLTDANRVAVIRQTTSHGEVGEQWKKAAGPPNIAVSVTMTDAADESLTEGAAANSRKRSVDESGLTDLSAPPAKVQKIPATMASSMSGMMRDIGRTERDWEEARLRRRQDRKDGIKDSSGSRAASVAPGTPGGSAPDGEKAMTKKEQKRLEAARKAEANSHVNQNLTSGKFLGTKPGGLFGKKSYSWMTGGGSGANTPKGGAGGGKAGGGGGGTPAPGTPVVPSQSILTVEGSASRRPGAWREDKDKGKNIQLRDWVSALEEDGIDTRALQRAYNGLDTSGPRQ